MAKDIILVQQEPYDMWQLIEVPVTRAGEQKIPLPDVQQLRSMEGQVIIIKELRLVTDKVLTRGVNQAGVTAPLAELQKMSLSLFSERWQRGQLMPLLMMNTQADADATAATTISYCNSGVPLNDWQNVDFPQSFLQLSNGTVTANVPYVVMFVAKYLKLGAPGTPVEGQKIVTAK